VLFRRFHGAANQRDFPAPLCTSVDQSQFPGTRPHAGDPNSASPRNKPSTCKNITHPTFGLATLDTREQTYVLLRRIYYRESTFKSIARPYNHATRQTPARGNGRKRDSARASTGGKEESHWLQSSSNDDTKSSRNASGRGRS
jgi:hypothetical protein